MPPGGTQGQRTVLLLSTDLVGRDELCSDLEKAGLEVMATVESTEAIRWTLERRIDLAVLNLDYLAIREAAMALRGRNPDILIVVLSASPKAPPTIAMMAELDIAAMKDKAVSHPELCDTILALLERPKPKESARIIRRSRFRDSR